MIYEYRCRDEACKQITSATRKVADRDNPIACWKCLGVTRKIISLSRPHPDMQPYFDENLETYIQGKQHRQKVMKDRGVSEYFGKGWT